MSTRVKICGITNVADAELAVSLGAYALGFNLIPESKRFVPVEQAARLVQAVRGRVLTIGVVADRSRQQLLEIVEHTGVDRLQLHGSEPPELVASLPISFKAVRIAGPDDVVQARSFSCEPLLVDAKVSGVLGGSGQTFDWSLVTELARLRPVVLAGGLQAANVDEAIRVVRPYAVDVASGVEDPVNPRAKDQAKLRQFFRAVASVGTVGRDTPDRRNT